MRSDATNRPCAAHQIRRQAARAPRCLALALLASLAAGTYPIAAQAQTADSSVTGGLVYTADEQGNSISVIDLRAQAVTTVPISITPHNVQVTADGTSLLVVGEAAAEGHGHDAGSDGHGGEETAGRLLIFEASHVAAGPSAEIGVGRHPAHVVADAAGRRAFVTNAGDDAVSVVDLQERSVIATVGTGRYPHGLRMSPDGREVYVANVADGSLSVIDTEALAEVARIPVGRTPVQVGFTPGSSQVYVSLRDENRVAIVDRWTRGVIGFVEVGSGPIQVHATPDGRFVYVANQGSEREPSDTVSVIDVAAGRVIDTVRTGRGAHGVSVSDDGRLVLVTNVGDGTVSVIDTTSRKVAATFPVGKGPNGVTYRSARD